MTDLVVGGLEIVLGLTVGFVGARVGGRCLATALGAGTILNAALVVHAAATETTCTSTIDCEPITTAGWTFLGIVLVGGWWLLVAIGAALAWRFSNVGNDLER